MSNKAGFGKHEGGSRDYVSIVAGKFAQRVTEDNTESVRRVIKKKDGSEKTVWELIYDDVTGYITGIEVKEDGDFGDQLNINMENSGHNFTVTLSMAGREAKGFLCCLKNIDLSEKLTLFPYNFVGEKGNQVIGLNIYQGANVTGMKSEERKKYKVLPWFSKETPNGLPQVPEDSDKDEFKLVMKSQEIYLKKWVKKFIADAGFRERPTKMEPNTAAENSTPIEKAYSGGTREPKSSKEKIYDNASNPSDDLPFRNSFIFNDIYA